MNVILRAAVAASSIAMVALTPATGVQAQPRTYDWSGLYLGANAGWMRSEADASWPNAAAGLASSFSHSTNAGAFGGHFGFQQQFGNILLGLEFAASGGKNHFDAGSPNSGCPNPGFTCDAGRLTSLYQVGPRLGFTFDNWLWYLSGGFASGHLETRSHSNATGLQYDSTTLRHNGWYFGGGVEYALNTEWVLGIEYQHISLDAGLHRSPVDAAANRIMDPDADVVRARLTYLLNFGRYVPDPLNSR